MNNNSIQNNDYLIKTLNKIYEMQKQLNKKSAKSKKIEPNWGRCIRQEVAETIDCFPWKHWKDVDDEVDTLNYIIELVDIFHFIVSVYIDDYPVINTASSKDEQRKIAFVNNVVTFSKMCENLEQTREANTEEILQDLEELILLTFNVCKLEEIKLDNFDSAYESKMHIDNLLAHFIKIVYVSGYNIEDILKGYIAKNILNNFRQKHGYAKGTYIKNWSGREDNHVLFEWLRENPQVTINDIEVFLEREYCNATESL